MSGRQWTEQQVNELVRLQMALVRFAATFEDEFPEGVIRCRVFYYDAGESPRAILDVPLTLGPGSADGFAVKYQ